MPTHRIFSTALTVTAALVFSGSSLPSRAATTNRARTARTTRARNTKPKTTTPSTSIASSVSSTTLPSVSSNNVMTLTSPVMSAGGPLPVAYTCDGAAHTPPLRWTSGPAGTVSYALVMHHVPGPGETHWYWVLHGIAPGVTNIDDNAVPSAKVGSNSVNDRNEYAPPCSKGPGAKQYIFTVYALSKVPAFSDSEKVTRQVLLDAINASVLATASLTVTYDRTSVVRAGVAP